MYSLSFMDTNFLEKGIDNLLQFHLKDPDNPLILLCLSTGFAQLVTSRNILDKEEMSSKAIYFLQLYK
jgi:hypothetical protein